MTVRHIRLSFIFLLPLFALIATKVQAQCDALSSRRDIFFTPTFGCAPTTVNRFEITYYFNLPQDPATIEIRYEWHDPANTVTSIKSGSGLVSGAGNLSFTANATFTYNNNNGQCSIRPTVSVVVNGVLCATSTQTQTAPFWGKDDQANGVVSLTPKTWSVCFGDPVSNALFRDNSQFNCNIQVEPDNPNRLVRHVQMVYGTNHNPAKSIADLTLQDGGTQTLTDGTGALTNPATRGTAGLLVTGGYFGPVQAIPFPADGPTSVSFPISAPANPANAVGNKFEVTLYNWNVCNPWNGDDTNPNYEDAIVAHAVITIVAPPAPAFDVQDQSGNSRRTFCANERFNLVNLTPKLNTYLYRWELYNDAAGTSLLTTLTTTQASFAYAVGGVKLIRLKARNPGAKGACESSVDLTITIQPTLKATIAVTDTVDVALTPYFCQEAAPPLQNFPVRFHDVSTGPLTPGTQWRWQFTNENGVITSANPTTGFSNRAIPVQDIHYQNPGVYQTYLTVRDSTTGCTTRDTAQVRVYQKPVPKFTATDACSLTDHIFTDASTYQPILGDKIILREWDFNYDGVTFRKDAAFDNQTSFTRKLTGAGVHQVALRVTTQQNSCSALTVVTVRDFAIPAPVFTADNTSGCGQLLVTFSNNTAVADSVMRFVWEADQHDGAGFKALVTRNAGDPDFLGPFTTTFSNTSSTTLTVDVRLNAVSVYGCTAQSPVQTLSIFPALKTGFFTLNYSPFNDNCSPQSVAFKADAATQALNPLNYVWRVYDADSSYVNLTTSSPNIQYLFTNVSDQARNYQVALSTKVASGCVRDSVITIRISPVPQSRFVLDTLSINCNDMVVRATALQQGLARYRWSISESSSLVQSKNSSDNFIEYTFQRPAQQNVPATFQLSTQNILACNSDTTRESLQIPQRETIIASFTLDSAIVTLPAATVQIANLSTSSPAATHHWDFGDGTTSNIANPPPHAYSSPGAYTVVLTVSTATCSDSQSQTVRVLDEPARIAFGFDRTEGCVPLTIHFSNQSRNVDTATLVWNFGPGESTSRATHPVHTFVSPGTYTVSLTAANASGQPGKVTREFLINAWPKPRAQFEVRPTVVYAPDGVLYTSNNSFDADSFLWNFGDGTTDTLPQPVHRYEKIGTYDITLLAKSRHGCADTAVVASAVTVRHDGRVLIPNAFSPSVSNQDGGSSNGKNDFFLPVMRGVSQFEMLIFNRWGQLLFQSQSPHEGWNGYYNGQLCEQDVYIYKITVTFDTGEKSVSMGDVNLIR